MTSASAKELLTPALLKDIATTTGTQVSQVEGALKLLLDDCTIPFIARYRKEATGNLDEVQIRDVRDRFEYLQALYERKEAILRSIEEQGKLTEPLKARIQACQIKAELEDLYLPFKPKKRTRAQIAKEKGLEPLAELIVKDQLTLKDLHAAAQPHVGAEVADTESALSGARDILSEKLSETPEIRGEIRQWLFENAFFTAEARPEHAEQKTKYNNYYNFREAVKTILPHRLMALRRGEKENILKVGLDFDAELPKGFVEARVLKSQATPEAQKFLRSVVTDAFDRLLAPSIETELRLETKSRAEEEAISVFAKNLRSLLLLSPIPRKMVLGIDPGLRTGSKLVVVDTTGKLLEHSTIFPDLDESPLADRNRKASQDVLNFLRKHKIEYVAIGNGTAGREVEGFVEKLLEAHKDLAPKPEVAVVNEAGASVYSASDVAREEFPDLDITYRGAVSIARRLQDPLAELVKIEPKSIGVGQYQHDVNQTRLKKQLDEVVESCVNYVGVNLNTASPSLLQYVSGIGPSLASNIVRHRSEVGEFKTRKDVLNVVGFGPKTYQQAAGFLRVPESPNPLDNTAVHPEAYGLVERMAADSLLNIQDFVKSSETLAKVTLQNYVSESVGLPTLQDILKELQKPGRDPRVEGARQSYSREVRSFEALQEGQVVTGSVTNVTNFGAFVDIGVHQDGLVHISEISVQFVQNPAEVLKVGEQVRVKIIGLDKERKRISLSIRALQDNAPGAGGQRAPQNAPRAGGTSQGQKGTQRQWSSSSPRSGASAQGSSQNSGGGSDAKKASLDDLMAKFNRRV